MFQNQLKQKYDIQCERKNTSNNFVMISSINLSHRLFVILLQEINVAPYIYRRSRGV